MLGLRDFFLSHFSLCVTPVFQCVGVFASTHGSGCSGAFYFLEPGVGPRKGSLLRARGPSHCTGAVPLWAQRGAAQTWAVSDSRAPPASSSCSFPALHGCWWLLRAFPRDAQSPLLLLSPCPKVGPSEPNQPRLLGTRLIHCRCSLCPPAFNSRGSNELGQRSMLSALLSSGLYSDMWKTLQKVELF